MSKARLALAVAGALLMACGGGGGGGGTCSPSDTATITINSTGASPQNTCVTPSGTLTFSNRTGDPHDIRIGTTSGSCPNGQPGVIQPGADASVKFNGSVATCTYADVNGNAAFSGIVGVDNQAVTGGGY